MIEMRDRRPAKPAVQGRDVWEVELGIVDLRTPKPIPVVLAEMKAWGGMHRGAELFMRPVTDGYLIVAYEEHGRLMGKAKVEAFRREQEMEGGLLALASGFADGDRP
jgi:hypothetical protein